MFNERKEASSKCKYTQKHVQTCIKCNIQQTLGRFNWTFNCGEKKSHLSVRLNDLKHIYFSA